MGQSREIESLLQERFGYWISFLFARNMNRQVRCVRMKQLVFEYEMELFIQRFPVSSHRELKFVRSSKFEMLSVVCVCGLRSAVCVS